MKLAIILSMVMLTGCAGVYKDPCIHIPVKQNLAVPHNEKVYGYTKEQFEAMPSYCGRPSKPRIYDRNGHMIGYIR